MPSASAGIGIAAAIVARAPSAIRDRGTLVLNYNPIILDYVISTYLAINCDKS